MNTNSNQETDKISFTNTTFKNGKRNGFGKIGQKSSFIIGGLTDVPPKEFAEHIEFINSIMYLLEYRYGVDAKTALRDAEKNLDDAQPQMRARVCYDADQFHVMESDFLVAVLTSPSTGTGQELERAASLGIPIFSFVMEPKKPKANSSKQYFLRGNDGGILNRGIYVGQGGLSIMVAGNPLMRKIITYKSDLRERPILHAVSHALEKLGWKLKELGGILANAGEILSKGLPGVRRHASEALKQLDLALQENLNLVPKSKILEGRIQSLEGKKNLNGNAKMIAEQIQILNEKKNNLDKLLEFNPLRLNHEIEKYAIFRVNASRTSHMFTKKYSTKKLRIGI